LSLDAGANSLRARDTPVEAQIIEALHKTFGVILGFAPTTQRASSRRAPSRDRLRERALARRRSSVAPPYRPRSAFPALAPAEAAKQSPEFLMTDLPARLKRGPITFHLKAQLGGPDDPTADATKPHSNKIDDLGVLTITNVVPDSDAVQKQLLFLPDLVTDGIEPSDDPLFATRDAANPISFAERNQ
jgi:hypothetical protein